MRNLAKYFSGLTWFGSQSPFTVGASVPSLSRRGNEGKKMLLHAQSHTASMWKNRDLNQVALTNSGGYIFKQSFPVLAGKEKD